MPCREWRKRGRIRCSDIAAPGYDASAIGITHEQLMAEIHGRLPDSAWLTGVEVFRRLNAAVGLGAPVAVTRLPGVEAHPSDTRRRLSHRSDQADTGAGVHLVPLGHNASE